MKTRALIFFCFSWLQDTSLNFTSQASSFLLKCLEILPLVASSQQLTLMNFHIHADKHFIVLNQSIGQIKSKLFIYHLLAMHLVPFTEEIKPLLLILQKHVALGRYNRYRLAIIRMSKQETCSCHWWWELILVNIIYCKRVRSYL